MVKIKNSKFVKSTLHWKEAPGPPLPEIAFVGRSNVGKSSLINCLLNRKNFARVSKQPGKTRTINYFSVNEAFYLVDLPGYGFARISRQEQASWQKAVEGYLLNSTRLKMLFVLIDGKVGAKDNDRQLIEWLNFHHLPYRIIATKIDKLGKNVRESQLESIYRALGQEGREPVLWFSAKDRNGRQELLNTLAHILN